MELRPAVPRRPARSVGTRDVRRWRTASRGRIRARRARRAGGRRDRRRRSPRRPLARDRRRRRVPGRAFATGCSTASARSPSTRWPTPASTEAALAAHAAWFADAAGSSTDGVRSSRPGRTPLVRPGRARQHRRRPGLVRGHTTRCSALTHRQRVRLGVGGARRQPGRRNGSWPPSTPPATRPRPRDRADSPAARGMAGSVDRRPRTTPATTSRRPPSSPRRSTIVDLQARCCYYLAYVVSHHGEFRQALALTDRSRDLYAGLDRPWDQAASWLFTARAAISAGDAGAQRRSLRSGRALAAERRRPVAARSPRRDARRAGARAAPVRRRRRSHRPCRRDVGTSRLPANGGVPAVQPRPSPVPGGRLRHRSCDPADRDRQGRSHRRRPNGGARQDPSRACAPCPRRAGHEARTVLEIDDRMAPRRRWWRTGAAR